jgi:S-(hydroxymethyl)glutathione dehydrogenase / alcohol dehydrogenase
MKAAICYEFGKPLVVEEVEIDPPQKGEVKVRIAATAVCYSDIHDIRGNVLELPLPRVPGHESAGYIEEVGEGVTSVRPGDPVVASNLASCWQCRSCRAGLPHLCETYSPFAPYSHYRNKTGQSLMQAVRMGSFAEYIIIHESQVVKIPGDMPMDSASLLSCGFITGFGAVINRAKVKPMSSVVVIGTGGVGLSSIQGAKLTGANPVIAVDILDNKLEAAWTFGATHTINAKKIDGLAAIQEITSGRGVDYAFITAGNAAAIRQGFSMLGKRGTVVLVGMSPRSETITFSPNEFFQGEKTLTACAMGSSNLSIDVPNLVNLYQAKQIKLDELITGRYPLDKINDAITSMVKGEAIRNIIMF